jgi:hypothetical protein
MESGDAFCCVLMGVVIVGVIRLVKFSRRIGVVLIVCLGLYGHDRLIIVLCVEELHLGQAVFFCFCLFRKILDFSFHDFYLRINR